MLATNLLFLLTGKYYFSFYKVLDDSLTGPYSRERNLIRKHITTAGFSFTNVAIVFLNTIQPIVTKVILQN